MKRNIHKAPQLHPNMQEQRAWLIETGFPGNEVWRNRLNQRLIVKQDFDMLQEIVTFVPNFWHLFQCNVFKHLFLEQSRKSLSSHNSLLGVTWKLQAVIFFFFKSYHEIFFLLSQFKAEHLMGIYTQGEFERLLFTNGCHEMSHDQWWDSALGRVMNGAASLAS